MYYCLVYVLSLNLLSELVKRNNMNTTLKEAFLRKYPKYENVLKMFEEANGCECTWDNVSKPKLHEFVVFLSDKLSPGSVRTYCAMFKSVLNLYVEEVDLPKGFDKLLSVKKEDPLNAYLSDSEIDKIAKYEPSNLTERIVRNCFLLGCVTGARYSDYVRFDRSNIVDNRLVYISQKTKVRAEVPLAPIVMRIFKENEEYNLLDKKVSDVTFNEVIRRICKRCGMTENVKLFKAGKEVTGEKWEFVSSHTARRSFCTNLYLMGCDLYAISKMSGHSSVTMTEKYICVGLRELNDKILGYFNGFE